MSFAFGFVNIPSKGGRFPGKVSLLSRGPLPDSMDGLKEAGEARRVLVMKSSTLVVVVFDVVVIVVVLFFLNGVELKGRNVGGIKVCG